MTPQQGTTMMRAVGGVQMAIGIPALLLPRMLARVFGIAPDQLNGPGLFGWRLFGIRQIVLGAGNVAEDPSTARANLAVQALDLPMFAQAFRDRSVPRQTSVMALATATLVTLASLASRSAK